MSLLKKVGRAFEKGAKRIITNPALNAAVSFAVPSAAPFLGVVRAAGGTRQQAAAGFAQDVQVGAAPGRGFQGSNVSVPLAIGMAGRAVLPRIGGALRSLGGSAAGGAAASVLFDAAGNPVAMRRRPRSKGITARELKSFTRVTALLNKFCKTPPPMKRRNAPRGKACR